MKNWQPRLEARRGPRYRQIVDELARDIRAGRLKAGSQLPTHRALADRLGLTVGTVTRAYAEAERLGLIAGQVGRGTFVNPLRDRAPGVAPRPRGVSLVQAARAGAGPADLATLTPLDPGRDALLAEMMQALLARRAPSERPAGGANGALSGPVAIAVADWLGHLGFENAPDRVVATGGGRAALAAALACLATPGDVVLTDAVTYDGLRPIAEALGLGLEPVADDGEGMRPESLELACWSSKARLLFLMPGIHNPTAGTLSERRRREIAAIARKYDLWLIEDEVCGALAPERPASFCERVPERAVLVTGLSKCLFDAPRLGFVSAPLALKGRLQDAVMALGLAADPLMLELFQLWMETGAAAALFDEQRRLLKARGALAGEILGDVLRPGVATAPHRWLELPDGWRPDTFLEEMRRRGVVLAPPQRFATEGTPTPNAVRLSLGAAAEADFGAALAAIADALGLDATDLRSHGPQGDGA